MIVKKLFQVKLSSVAADQYNHLSGFYPLVFVLCFRTAGHLGSPNTIL